MKNKWAKVVCFATCGVAAIACVLSVVVASGGINLDAKKVYASFYNYDGELLWKTNVPAGNSVQYQGRIPEKPGDEQYSYTFSSWDKSLSSVGTDTSFFAVYARKPREYKVTFENYNHAILYTTNVQYGGTAIYLGEVPERPSDELYAYTFSGWDKPYDFITEDTILTATYDQTDVEFKVEFMNFDESLLYTDYVVRGGKAKYRGLNPIRPSDETYQYTFKGWDMDISCVLNNIKTHALYYQTQVEYKVDFYNYDNTLLYTDHVPYNGTAHYNGITPTRKADGNYEYQFSGWNKPLTEIKKDLAVVAQFELVERKYSVSFYNYDDEFLYQTWVTYSQDAIYVGNNPERPDDEKYTYSFAGWDREINNVTEDIIVYPKWDRELRKFKCTFLDYDGTLLQVSYVTWGQNANFFGATPYKPSEANWVYTFIGWEESLEDIETDTVFHPLFDQANTGSGSGNSMHNVDFYDINIYNEGEPFEPMDSEEVHDEEEAFFVEPNLYDIYDKPYVNVNGFNYRYVPEIDHIEQDEFGNDVTFYVWTQDVTCVTQSMSVCLMYHLEIVDFWYAYAYGAPEILYIVDYCYDFRTIIYTDYVEPGKDSIYKGPGSYISDSSGFVRWSEDVTNVNKSMRVYPIYDHSF